MSGINPLTGEVDAYFVQGSNDDPNIQQPQGRLNFLQQAAFQDQLKMLQNQTPQGGFEYYKPPSMQNMGGSGIASFLQPIINYANQKTQADLQERVQPYIEQVTELTNQYFPDAFSSGSGINQGIGGFSNSMNPYNQNQLQSSSYQSPFGVGSLFR